MLIELVVLLGGHVLLGAHPQRRSGVENLFSFGLGFLGGELDRQADVVGMRLHDFAQAMFLGELGLVLAQVQHDGRAAPGAFGQGDGEAALAVRRPTPRLARSSTPARHLDLVGDDERRIEADAELADQRDVAAPAFDVLWAVLMAVALVLGKLLGERGRAGSRDGAEVIDQVLARHADTVVGDGQGARLGVGLQYYLQFGIVGGERRVGDRLIAQPVARVRRVRDQLAQEHFLAAIQRVGDDLEELGDLGLEGQGLSTGLLSHGVSFAAVVDCRTSVAGRDMECPRPVHNPVRYQRGRRLYK